MTARRRAHVAGVEEGAGVGRLLDEVRVVAAPVGEDGASAHRPVGRHGVVREPAPGGCRRRLASGSARACVRALPDGEGAGHTRGLVAVEWTVELVGAGLEVDREGRGLAGLHDRAVLVDSIALDGDAVLDTELDGFFITRVTLPAFAERDIGENTSFPKGFALRSSV